jgi:hypothetical protein
MSKKRRSISDLDEYEMGELEEMEKSVFRALVRHSNHGVGMPRDGSLLSKLWGFIICILSLYAIYWFVRCILFDLG